VRVGRCPPALRAVGSPLRRKAARTIRGQPWEAEPAAGRPCRARRGRAVPVAVLVCWVAWLVSQPVPAPGVLRVSTPALGLLVGVRVLELAEGDLGVASGVVELSWSPAAGAVLQLQRAGDVGVQRQHLVQAGGVQQPGDVAACGGQAKLAVAGP